MLEKLGPISRGKLLELAGSFGTPLYIYDAEVIRSQYLLLKQAFAGADADIRFAMKALSNPAVLKLLAGCGCGIDAVSPGEVKLALRAGLPTSKISFTPSCPAFAEVEAAVDQGVHVTLDSLPVLKRFGSRFGGSVPCSVRLNPHIKAGDNEKVQTGHRASKFGISIEQLGEITAAVRADGLRIIGLHVHTGSDIADPDVFLRSAEVLFEAAEVLPEVEIFDLGGGFKVGYRYGESDADVARIGASFAERLASYRSRTGRKARVWLEPGKFLVSRAGVLLVEATVVKRAPARTFVGVNSGLNHLIRPMMYGAYHEVENISRPEGPEMRCDVVGYICETDTLASDRLIAEAGEGDILAVRSAGAYGFTMSSNYNMRERPAEVLLDGEDAVLIRRRETFDDMLAALC